MDEANLQEIEARANETVRRCGEDDCDAPARFYATLPGGGGYMCAECAECARVLSLETLYASDLDALDLVAEVRRMRGTS